MTLEISELYRGKKMVGISGMEYQIDTTSISREEGEFIHNLILNNPNIKNTLEVGCAWGLSSLFICFALQYREEAHHTIVDPFQMSQWDGVGVNNLISAGFSNFRLIEEKSETALPNLLMKSEEAFDFIFIDGWHTFDHTLIDIFYALRLVRIGGMIVIDDLTMPGVRQAVEYFLQFENIKLVGELTQLGRSRNRKLIHALLFKNPLFRNSLSKIAIRSVLKSKFYYFIYPEKQCSMVALQKIGEDIREWNWHNDSF